MARIYDKELKCGCMLSKDGCGGVMPCYAEFGNMSLKKDREALDLHNKCWTEFERSEEYQEYFPALEESSDEADEGGEGDE